MAKKEFKKSKALYAVSMPEDFNFDEHAALNREDFENDGLFLQHKAKQYRYRALMLDERADFFFKYGSKATVRKAAKLVALLEKMKALKKELVQKGVPIDGIIEGSTK